MLNHGPPWNLSELPIMNRVWSNPPSHKVQKYSIDKWNGHLWYWTQQALEIQVTWESGPNAHDPYSRHITFSPSLHLWLQGEFSMVGWLSTAGLGLEVLHIKAPKWTATPLQLPSGTSLKMVVKGNTPSGQNYKQFGRKDLKKTDWKIGDKKGWGSSLMV